jgi:glycosyltransferase involved in cell wall biosynthesis
MRIALIAPPFIPVPPTHYGGTELFIANLAQGLKARGHEPVVYTIGESTIPVERRWMYEKSEWPLQGDVHNNLKDLAHSAWAVRDAAQDCDILHLNNAPGLATTPFVELPIVHTVHHVHEPALSTYYGNYPDVNYVTISRFQMTREAMPRMRAILHGIDLSLYRLQERKQPYLSFLGRIAPIKGVHLAIEIAMKAGMPLRIAGEVQPMFRDYFREEIEPQIDGKFIEFVGEMNLEEKIELLGNSMALLFPIQWNEPFGLVMVEAMACGTPVLAFSKGSVPELVRDGISGYVGNTVEELASRLRDVSIPAARVRSYAEQHFSLQRMADEYIALYEEIKTGRQDQSITGDRAIA